MMGKNRVKTYDVACFQDILYNIVRLTYYIASMVASAGETDRDLAGMQFPRNCVPYNIIEF